tara:strand:- start:5932 stop:9153 length:3222 start_codon:yes stop_codon:yes gene_type:complete
MAYKRSTSFSGFRSRLSPDESREIANAAKAADRNRIETTKGMERASSQQITELNRLSNLSAQADQYEIQNLAKFSDSLNKAVQAGAKTLGVDYINRARQAAYNDYRDGLAGDEEALAKTKLNESQVKEINEKINQLETETELKLSEAERNEKFLSYEQKYRLLNARRLGSNYAYGYTKAHMIEAANGFMPWFMNKTNEDDTVIEMDDGREIRVNEYDTFTNAADRYAVENQLIKEYEDQNNISGVNTSIVDKYLTSSVTKQLQQYRDKKLNDEIQAQAAEKIRLQSVNLNTAVVTFDAEDTTDFDNAIDQIVLTGNNLHFRAGTQGSSGAANKKNLKDSFVDSVASLDSDVKIMEVLNHIEQKEYQIPNLGKKTLVNAFPIEFRMEDLKASIFAKREDNLSKKIRSQTTDLKLKIAQLKYHSTLTEDNPNYISYKSYSLQVKELQEDPNYGALPEAATIFNNAFSFKPVSLGKDNSAKAARKEIERYGSLSVTTYMTLNKDDQKKYESAVSEDVRWDQTTEGKKLLDMYLGDDSKFDKALTLSFLGPSKGLDTSGSKSVLLQNALYYAKNTDIWARVEVMRKNKEFDGQIPPDMDPNMYYFQKAAEQITLQMQTAADPKGGTAEQRLLAGNPYALTFGGDKLSVFANSLFQEAKDTSLSTKLAEADNIFQNFEGRLDKTVGDDPILTLSDTLFENEGQKNQLKFVKQGGVYKGETELVQKLSMIDPKKRDPFTLGNLLREKYNLETVEFESLPQDRQDIITLFKQQNADVRDLLMSPYSKLKEQGIDMSGLISVNNLHRAINTAGFDHTDIDDADVADILANAGFTRQEYNENEDIQGKVFKIHVNNLLNKAILSTENKSIAIQKVAAEFGNGKYWYSGSNKGLTNSVLKAYYRGWNIDDKDQFLNVVEDAAGNITRLNFGELSAETNNMNSNIIQAEIDELVEPPKYVVGSNNRRTVNRDWKDWNKNQTKLKAQQNVLKQLETTTYTELFYGVLGANMESRDLYYNIKASLGDKHFKQLLKTANDKYTEKTGRPYDVGRISKSQQLKKDRVFSDLFFAELIKTEQFFRLDDE